jgi:hypothetical protein
MRQLNHLGVAVVFLAFLFGAVRSRTVTPNPKLVALVPPATNIVAGLNVPPRSGQPSTFLLTSHYGTIDLNDFISTTGADPERAFDQIIIVATDRGGGAYSGHSLMAIGRFNQNLIYRSVSQAGARVIQYDGIAVLEMQPFARERDSLHDVRWLAMMDSKLAVFGTPALVQQELDRYRSHSVPDPLLERRLSQLRHDDVSWCVATLPEGDDEIRPIFRALDSKFAELLRIGDTVEFGIRYGRQVEFEYEVNLASGSNAEAIPRSFAEPITTGSENAVIPVSTFNRVDGGVRGVLKVSKARYESWLAEAIANVRPTAADMPTH